MLACSCIDTKWLRPFGSSHGRIVSVRHELWTNRHVEGSALCVRHIVLHCEQSKALEPPTANLAEICETRKGEHTVQWLRLSRRPESGALGALAKRCQRWELSALGFRHPSAAIRMAEAPTNRRLSAVVLACRLADWPGERALRRLRLCRFEGGRDTRALQEEQLPRLATGRWRLRMRF